MSLRVRECQVRLRTMMMVCTWHHSWKCRVCIQSRSFFLHLQESVTETHHYYNKNDNNCYCCCHCCCCSCSCSCCGRRCHCRRRSCCCCCCCCCSCLLLLLLLLIFLFNQPVSPIFYAVSAWWGFTSAADRQCLQALLQRGIRSGLCSPETPTLTELAESIDDALFQRIMHNPYHVIHHLLPARRELAYNIRQRHHDRQLSIISGQLRNRNFIYHMLFKDCY